MHAHMTQAAASIVAYDQGSKRTRDSSYRKGNLGEGAAARGRRRQACRTNDSQSGFAGHERHLPQSALL